LIFEKLILNILILWRKIILITALWKCILR